VSVSDSDALTFLLADPNVTAMLTDEFIHRARLERNRAAQSQPPPPAPGPVRDVDGYNLRPDPMAATTAGELVAALREYRAWADNPPYRKMAAQARQVVGHSTMYAALKNDTELPRLKVVIAIIAGCGGDDEEQRAWATAWRRISMGKHGGQAAAETPALRALPAVAEASG
jgi:hypothetical protein